MMIAGIKGISLIDYPQKVATVLYLSQCNFRCPFCHNSQLVLNQDVEPIEQREMIQAIKSRRDFIDGVVITGGEPTIYPDLVELAAAIKPLGFAIKLDTNGYNPDALKVLINEKVVDFIAMDIKTSWAKYKLATGVDVDRNRLIESIGLIKEAHVGYEFRTTCVPRLVNKEDIEEISKLVGSSGRYTLQQFQPENTLDPEYSKVNPYAQEVLTDFQEIARRNTGTCRLIGV